MRVLRCTPFAIALCAALGGCDIYRDHFKGDFNAGSADPSNYPPAYRGVGFTRNIAGSGTGITEVRAYIGGNQTGYFLFPYGTTQVVTPGFSYPAASVTIPTQTRNALTINRLPTLNTRLPLAYVFDPQPDANPPNPFPDTQQCQSAPGYQYDQRRDDVRYDEQGNIFTLLPSATFAAGGPPSWNYVPVVQEVPVASNGEPCQEIKSERTLMTRGDLVVGKNDSGSAGVPDGRYLAWALFDPGAAVYRVGQTAANSTGLGIQRWGWYQQFLVAYLDGGYIPLASATQFRTQQLFIPRANVILTCAANADCVPFAGTAPGDAACETATGRCRTSTRCTSNAQCAGGPGATCDTAVGFCRQPTAGNPGRPAVGYDVLESSRGTIGYSPICEVFTYRTPQNSVPVTSLPRDAATVNSPAFGQLQRPPNAVPNSIVPGTFIQPFVFCLQVP